MLGLTCACLADVPAVAGWGRKAVCLSASPSECPAKKQGGFSGLQCINPGRLAGYGANLQAGGAYLKKH